MARRGWDALSENYRQRLIRQGISRSSYESGASLHKARGHRSASDESFTKRIRRFVNRYDSPEDPKAEISRIKKLGSQRAQEYMDYRRKMTSLYEGGDYQDAERMYMKRDTGINRIVMYRTRDNKLVDGTWWYHGIFGG